MKTLEQLSLFESRKMRDEALERVTKPTFSSLAIPIIAALSSGEYTGEDIRIHVARKGFRPHHPNGWGALIMTAIRLGLITDTGKTAHMKIKTSHARRTPVYVK